MSTQHNRCSDAPRVTIGLPVYNGEDFLAAALESLLEQSFTDFELIISDNGSDDSTQAICEKFAAEDRRVIYLREQINRGAAWNYNRLVERARGEFFKWAAHDDLCSPGYLEQTVAALDENRDAVLAFSHSIFIDAEGREVGLYYDRLDINHHKPHRRMKRLVRTLHFCNSVFGLIRLSALKKTHLIGTHLSSDKTLLTELALLGHFHQVEDFLFYRRQHEKMSVAANRKASDLRAWFDPAERDVRDYKVKGRLRREQYRVIWRSDLTLTDKLLCSTSTCVDRFYRKWFKRNFHADFQRLLPVE
ncbi:glycosyltransferase family 2 protein [Candidatus Reidiella endopervernicosa]|uniref:Glycosyltransferase family 2 protein n=1 Tax=Candidatus Reidiella endopervernicosa TaxID=2738883 RepID=A0A6N0HVL1_9GAMM|nr:glycosyltransferase family 2 protein [Candidatus Reidiella endopervernicosa]QKQ26307.1 glycosyltransferase family 2 protein [Candidatus Reidiella endopervernicosa]